MPHYVSCPRMSDTGDWMQRIGSTAPPSMRSLQDSDGSTRTVETPIARELIRRAQALSDALSAHGIRHAFMGGIATNTWAVPAPTYDIDVCALLGPDDVSLLIRVLEPVGFVPPMTTWVESIGTQGFREVTFRWPFESTLRPADVFLAADPFQRQALERSRRVEIADGFFAHVITPEDLVIYKLVAFRNKDRAAIDRVLAVQGSLDWAYVRGWSDRFGIGDRLHQAMIDNGLDPRSAS